MNINPYQGLPATCRTCLNQIVDESQIYLNFPSRTTDFISIHRRLSIGLPYLEPNREICHGCYAASDIPFYSNGFTSEDNKSDLLTYKILSDILKEEPISDVHEIAPKTSQEQPIFLKQAETWPTLFNSASYCAADKTNNCELLGYETQNAPVCYECKQCEFSATSKSSLTTHVKTNHNKRLGEKSHKCTECNFKCGSKSYLNIHMRIHTGETPYKCDICSYSTTFKYSLSVHMRTHTGDKPYRCTQCDFRCSTKGYLETHMRVHTGEMPYKCNQCGYCTAFKYTLSVHMRTHLGNKPYECEECKFKCGSESYLKKHVKMHSGIRYTCNLCPYSAPYRSAVTVHMKTHTGEKPYRCTRCNYRAYKKYDVRKHMKVHSREAHSTVIQANLI